jgi:hypothetical protein
MPPVKTSSVPPKLIYSAAALCGDEDTSKLHPHSGDILVGAHSLEMKLEVSAA